MIVVFVVDTSPSMMTHLSSSKNEGGNGMTRLDLAKMAVESLVKSLTKRVTEHNLQLQQQMLNMQQSLHNMGLGYFQQDQFLLLSTGRQYPRQPSTASCGAGGRLLVGFGDYMTDQSSETLETQPQNQSHGSFDRELKHLQATVWKGTGAAGAQPQNLPFPEDGGGAVGLNVALSTGLGLLSRYRLKNRLTENFGMGRLTSPTMLTPSGNATASLALQPACLVLITDGECLRRPPSEGGGSLQLQKGVAPLREFYQEPFRWDQRIFCIGVGANDLTSSMQFLHPSLKALCEVTGGFHMVLRSTASLSQAVDQLTRVIAPPRPLELPMPDPLRLPNFPPLLHTTEKLSIPTGSFVSGGPVCCFQGLEAGPAGEPSPTNRAMILYVPWHHPGLSSPSSSIVQAPMWWIPEAYFPSKKLDSLPPRLAQPLLTFSRSYASIGSNTFDPFSVMKALHRLDQLTMINRKPTNQGGQQQQAQPTLLRRDVYICEWITQDGRVPNFPRDSRGSEYYPICVRGGGRSLSEGEEQLLNIGILHVPHGATTLKVQSSGLRLSTLTLLPPEPHIVLPLLIRAAEAEHRLVKKSPDKPPQSRNVHLDDNWRSEFRAYMFRIPPYYHNALKRCLRPVLPASAHSLLNFDGVEGLVSQCFSKVCLQKIRNGEQVARDMNERLERQEAELRRRGVVLAAQTQPRRADEIVKMPGYGQYDPRATITSYLAALRTMPAPWRSGMNSFTAAGQGENLNGADNVVGHLGDLPANCLIPFYEARRRWVFGGSGLTVRNVFVEGAGNDGSNTQRCYAKPSPDKEPLLALCGIGVSTLNKTTTIKMGDYRERLLWTRAPVVGYGSNDSGGVAATTAADGSPVWSVDDDAMPISFFDAKTGAFSDSMQARVRSRLTVHFGNPFMDKRGDSLIPEAFAHQRPPRRGKTQAQDVGPLTPPGSPPHEDFAVEGAGEAVFAGQTTRKVMDSPPPPKIAKKREAPDGPAAPSEGKKLKKTVDVKDEKARDVDPKSSDKAPPKKPAAPPPPPAGKKPTSDAPPRPNAPSRPPPPKPRPPPPKPPAAPPKPSARRPPPPKRLPPKRIPSGDLPNSPPKKPPGGQKPPAPAQPAKKAQQPPPPPSAAGQSPDKKPKVNLPPGWMSVWSKSQKRWYFFDTKTNKSVWQWPPPSGTNP